MSESTNSSKTSTESSSTEDRPDTDSVRWFLIDEDAGEVISTSGDISDLIEARKHIDAETRLTDTAPPDYEQDKPSGSPDWGLADSL